jgi:transcriptional regulator with XRE-family HTH domain
MGTEPEDRQKLLSRDAGMISGASRAYARFAFSNILSAHLKKKGLTRVDLGRRLGLSHQAVSKWCSGGARPQDKETAKEIGLALGLTEGEMNELLLSLGYTPLYPKSPLDSACIFILNKHGSAREPLGEYREFVERRRVRDIGLLKDRATIPTLELRKKLGRILTEDELENWLKENIIHFSASEDTLLPKVELQLFIKLFLGGDSINRQYKNHFIPKIIRDWLYPMTSGGELTQKELRNKLIAFALFKNMTIGDINFMLELAKLRKFSSPENTYEAALLIAVRLAHDRFPPYEDDYLGCVVYPELEKILAHYSKKEGASLSETELRRKKFSIRLKDDVINRIDATWERAEKYRLEARDEAEGIFEKYYTDRNLDYSRCLAVYIRDITRELIREGAVSGKEAEPLYGLLQLEDEN